MLFNTFTRLTTYDTISLQASMAIEGADVVPLGLGSVVRVWGEYPDDATMVTYHLRVVQPGESVPGDVGGAPHSAAGGKVWIWSAE